jgi:hypothetical protein
MSLFDQIISQMPQYNCPCKLGCKIVHHKGTDQSNSNLMLGHLIYFYLSLMALWILLVVFFYKDLIVQIFVLAAEDKEEVKAE